MEISPQQIEQRIKGARLDEQLIREKIDELKDQLKMAREDLVIRQTVRTECEYWLDIAKRVQPTGEPEMVLPSPSTDTAPSEVNNDDQRGNAAKARRTSKRTG
jgi:hypothetical protein